MAPITRAKKKTKSDEIIGVDPEEMQPCRVNLVRANFSKIRIHCSAQSSEENVDLLCNLRQETANSFTLKIKRKLHDSNDDWTQIAIVSNPPKKFKSNPSKYREECELFLKFLGCFVKEN